MAFLNSSTASPSRRLSTWSRPFLNASIACGELDVTLLSEVAGAEAEPVAVARAALDVLDAADATGAGAGGSSVQAAEEAARRARRIAVFFMGTPWESRRGRPTLSPARSRDPGLCFPSSRRSGSIGHRPMEHALRALSTLSTLPL